MSPTVATPNLLSGPGYLFGTAIGSALPANTASGGVFTDPWPVAWVPLGATTTGTSFQATQTLSPLDVEEFIDHIGYRMTGRESKVQFSLAQPTAMNLQRAFNGGTLSVISGTGLTQVADLTPPAPGSETRLMIGYESADHTIRFFGFQAINAATVQIDFKKAPNISAVPFDLNLEVSATYGVPYKFSFAGTAAYGQ